MISPFSMGPVVVDSQSHPTYWHPLPSPVVVPWHMCCLWRIYTQFDCSNCGVPSHASSQCFYNWQNDRAVCATHCRAMLSESVLGRLPGCCWHIGRAGIHLGAFIVASRVVVILMAQSFWYPTTSLVILATCTQGECSCLVLLHCAQEPLFGGQLQLGGGHLQQRVKVRHKGL